MAALNFSFNPSLCLFHSPSHSLSPLRPSSHVPVFDRPGANRTEENTPWKLVHTFRFSTGWQVPIIAGQSSGTQKSTGVITQPGRLAGRKTPECVNVSISNTAPLLTQLPAGGRVY
jgi:hypothetical protein